jgi:hypothetical protein
MAGHGVGAEDIEGAGHPGIMPAVVARREKSETASARRCLGL